MPHPLFLKIMGALPHQYNALKSDQKDEFNAEAQRRIAELQNNDMEAYIELTNSSDEPTEETTTEKRRFF
jgi:hypothetical protein